MQYIVDGVFVYSCLKTILVTNVSKMDAKLEEAMASQKADVEAITIFKEV